MTARKPKTAAPLADPKYVAIRLFDFGARQRGARPPFDQDDYEEYNCVWFDTAEAAAAWYTRVDGYTVYRIGAPVTVKVEIVEAPDDR